MPESTIERLRRQAYALDDIGCRDESLLITSDEVWEVLTWACYQIRDAPRADIGAVLDDMQKKINRKTVSIFGHILEVAG